jgi:hypothetical protein
LITLSAAIEVVGKIAFRREVLPKLFVRNAILNARFPLGLAETVQYTAKSVLPNARTEKGLRLEKTAVSGEEVSRLSENAAETASKRFHPDEVNSEIICI